MGSRPRLLSQQTLNVQRATPQWARIGSVAGAASDTTYTDAAGITWRCVQWTATNASGLVVAVPGLVDLLIVGGGGSDWQGHSGGGSGGRVVHGLHRLAAITHGITVGAGGAGTTDSWGGYGGNSALGTINTGRVAGGTTGHGSTSTAGFVSAITGTSVEYARGAQNPANTPGTGGLNVTGASGIVILRVPA